MASKKRARIIRMLKTEYHIGDAVPQSAIYECSECEKIAAFKQGERFLPCEDDHGDDEQLWYRTNQLVHFVSRNLNTEFEKLETISLRVADFIAESSGTMGFVYFHVAWFGIWIYLNIGKTKYSISQFDPFPFGLLTMIVSLEAIILSTFILISQSRQSMKSELRADLDYQTNVKIEKDVAEILSMLQELREEGKLLTRETGEVLEDAHILLGKKKPEEKMSSAKRRLRKKAEEIIEEAGIDVIEPEN